MEVAAVKEPDIEEVVIFENNNDVAWLDGTAHVNVVFAEAETALLQFPPTAVTRT